MDRINLRFYTHELVEHHTLFLHEWLLVLGNRLGIPAGTAMRAIAGYDHSAHPSEHRVQELIVNRPVVVEFIVSEEEANKLLAMIAAEGLHTSYTQHPVKCQVVGSPT